MASKILKLVTLAGGLALFIWLLSDVDLDAVGTDLARIGWHGAGMINQQARKKRANEVRHRRANE